MLQKLNSYATVVFMILGVLLMVLTMRSDLNAEGGDWAIGWFLSLSYILLFLAIAAALGGTVITALSNPKKIGGSLIGIGVMLAIVGLSYVLSSDEVLRSYGDITPGTSKWSGAGLYMVYILLAGSVLSIVYASVSRMIK